MISSKCCKNALLIALCFSQLPPIAVGIDLHGFDPRIFNFMTDLIAIVIQATFAFCLAGCYGLFANNHLKKHKTVPLEAVGQIPDRFGLGLVHLCTAGWSVSFAFLVALLAINDLSQAIAKLGLDFKITMEVGPSDTVLSLHTPNRNKKIPLEALGEPYSHRMSVFVQGIDDSLNYEEAEKFIRQGRQITSFMHAADYVARGTSPFLSSDSLAANNEKMEYDDTGFYYGGIEMSNIYHAGSNVEDRSLVGVNLSLPVNCSDRMVEVEQTLGIFLEDRRNINSLVPGCSFEALRPSGIFKGANSDDMAEETNKADKAEITGYIIAEAPDFSVVADGRSHHGFLMPAKSRQLPRDRLYPRSGRLVDNIIDAENGASMGRITSIEIGSESFPVGTVVVARGRPLASQSATSNFTVDGCPTTTVHSDAHEYAFVSEIQGECPLDPAGMQKESCLAILTAVCDEFQEDAVHPEEIVLGGPDTLSVCILGQIQILWGRNFDADSELTVAVAGVYGRNQITVRGIQEEMRLSLHLIPAALFMMSTISELPSNSEVIIPTINAVYIFFMLLPLVLSVVALVASCKVKKKNIVWPDEPWKLAMVANETAPFPYHRSGCREEFPEEVSALRYGIIGHDDLTKQDIFGILLPEPAREGSASDGHNNGSQPNITEPSSLNVHEKSKEESARQPDVEIEQQAAPPP